MVASLLLIHGLYPVELETRVHEALESVRPYMESHGGDVELLGIEDGVARLRLVGHCEGCPASEATLELAIKKALEETAPDLEGLEVEGVHRERRPRRRSSCRWSSRNVRRTAGNGSVDRRRRTTRRTPRPDGAVARSPAPTCSWPTWAGRCWPTATRAAGAGRGSTRRR